MLCQICFSPVNQSSILCCDTISCDNCISQYLEITKRTRCVNTNDDHPLEVDLENKDLTKSIINNLLRPKKRIAHTFYDTLHEVYADFLNYHRDVKDLFLNLKNSGTFHKLVSDFRQVTMENALKTIMVYSKNSVETTPSHVLYESLQYWDNITATLYRYLEFIENDIGKEIYHMMKDVLLIINNVIFQRYDEGRNKFSDLIRDNLKDFIFPFHDQFILPLNEIESQTFHKFKGDENFFRIIMNHIHLYDTKISKHFHPFISDFTKKIEENKKRHEQQSRLRFSCSSTNCTGTIIVGNKITYCPECLQKHCAHCGSNECNKGAECTTDNSHLSFVQCPSCSIPIFKVEGCSHMTCTHCHSMFDYESLISLRNDPYFENPHRQTILEEQRLMEMEIENDEELGEVKIFHTEEDMKDKNFLKLTSDEVKTIRKFIRNFEKSSDNKLDYLIGYTEFTQHPYSIYLIIKDYYDIIKYFEGFHTYARMENNRNNIMFLNLHEDISVRGDISMLMNLFSQVNLFKCNEEEAIEIISENLHLVDIMIENHLSLFNIIYRKLFQTFTDSYDLMKNILSFCQRVMIVEKNVQDLLPETKSFLLKLKKNLNKVTENFMNHLKDQTSFKYFLDREKEFYEQLVTKVAYTDLDNTIFPIMTFTKAEELKL